MNFQMFEDLKQGVSPPETSVLQKYNILFLINGSKLMIL